VATLADLTTDALAWLNRRDIEDRIAGYVSMVETDIATVLRARCMVVRATQAIDDAFVSLPLDFCSMESLRDVKTGKLLSLEDHFTGPLGPVANCPSHAYRLVGDCIEFMPHPQVPNPPLLGWQPQMVSMVWFRKPKPLRLPTDSNPVLERHYQAYLFGVVRYGAMYELDPDREKQATEKFADAVSSANAWKVASDYSGAPLRAAPAVAY
jgi:hypothetical protein